jgi:hypothetical protein
MDRFSFGTQEFKKKIQRRPPKTLDKFNGKQYMEFNSIVQREVVKWEEPKFHLGKIKRIPL